MIILNTKTNTIMETKNTTVQNDSSMNEKRMESAMISKSTRNMLIAAGKIEDAVDMIVDEVIEVFGEGVVDDLTQEITQCSGDMRNRVFYLISLVMQEKFSNLKPTAIEV